jgi:hypothetical protein
VYNRSINLCVAIVISTFTVDLRGFNRLLPHITFENRVVPAENLVTPSGIAREQARDSGCHEGIVFRWRKPTLKCAA